MLLSMTGYGRANGSYADKSINVEIRTLNSKLTDLKLRFPGDYKEKEIALRRRITEHADRGKIDFLLDVQNADGAASVSLNEGLFRGYYRELSRIAKDLGIESGDIMQTILRIPNVVNAPSGEMDEEEWKAVCVTVDKALNNLKKFREQEGAVLEAELRMRVELINSLLLDVPLFEEGRITKMKERLKANLDENLGSENIDQNRFEQEILFYLEKMDITEEKVRLANHCKYFLEQMDKTGQAIGRTLGFISQEMGREINTLGAKAYDSEMQKLVVQMKEELEKIKEQLANVL
jgi:uncharacterized protein (TIGR00255 family)